MSYSHRSQACGFFCYWLIGKNRQESVSGFIPSVKAQKKHRSLNRGAFSYILFIAYCSAMVFSATTGALTTCSTGVGVAADVLSLALNGKMIVSQK